MVFLQRELNVIYRYSSGVTFAIKGNQVCQISAIGGLSAKLQSVQSSHWKSFQLPLIPSLSANLLKTLLSRLIIHIIQIGLALL